MKRFLILIFSILYVYCSNASPQSPDYVVCKNDTIPIYQLILESYLHSIEPDQGNLFGLSFRDNATFSCWRGYQAIFLIENDSLFLTHIISCGELCSEQKVNVNNSDKKLKKIFNEKVVNSRVFVDWFSGNVTFPRGKLLKWDGVFSRTYYKEEVLEFHKGLLKNKKNVENYIDLPNGISRTNDKLITDTIFSKVKHLDWKKLSDCDCAGKYIITINEKGKIDNIEIAHWTDDKKQMEEATKEHAKCIRLFKKCLRKLQFDIIRWNGQPYKEQVIFEIFYSDEEGLENWSPYRR